MRFKDKLNKIIKTYVNEDGLKRVEKSLADDESYAIQVGCSPKSVAAVTDISSQEILGKKFIDVLTSELFYLVKNEFISNASSMQVAQGLSVENRLRNALGSVDVDMICEDHESITCKICFGDNYLNVPAGRTAAEYRKANALIHACFHNTYEEKEFLKERIQEIRTGKVVDSPLTLNPELHIRDKYSFFISEHSFEYDNKRGFKGVVSVPDYINRFVTELYLNDDEFEAKALSLAIEVETLYSKFFSCWIEYTNKQRFVVKPSIKALLDEVIPNSRVQHMIEEMRNKPA